MAGFATFVAVLFGIALGLLVLYSNRSFTMPSYVGRGGWLHALAASGLGLLALLWVGKWAGSANIYTDIATNFEFSFGYGIAYLKTAAIAFAFGLLGVAGVTAYNLSTNGRAIM